ncbi:MAG: hypothetical protein KF798_06660 [Candidatus Paracaedibacteraceae bacterium]|nr:hypothetical protein [Candidatus Paracaedibacteraceae bacterium]
MDNIIKIHGQYSKLEDVTNLVKSQRYTDRYSKLDYDHYINKAQTYFCFSILVLEHAIYYVFLDDGRKYLSYAPAELFSDKEIIIPKEWRIVLHPEIEGRQILHPKLAAHLDWWSRYHDDDPQILAIIDEIISDIEAKNPKKDPFDDYWGL